MRHRRPGTAGASPSPWPCYEIVPGGVRPRPNPASEAAVVVRNVDDTGASKYEVIAALPAAGEPHREPERIMVAAVLHDARAAAARTRRATKLYGLGSTARGCLMAVRLVERAVRIPCGRRRLPALRSASGYFVRPVRRASRGGEHRIQLADPIGVHKLQPRG